MKKTTLVVGASGATGRLLVEQLLTRGECVKVIVRSPARLPAAVKQHEKLTVIQAGSLDLSDAEMAQHVSDCHAVASCLGHHPSFQGIYGRPYRLVTDAVRRLCNAVKATEPTESVKFVLMNTADYRNRDLNEPLSPLHKTALAVLRLLLPPQADNEQAADYLRTRIGQSDRAIQWTVVRPDTLLDEQEVTAYELHASPLRSALFDAGQTSRINVSHFMAELITNDAVWQRWRGQMPVIYNKTSS